MYGQNLKITTKLFICAAAFLLPLGIMLFLIILPSVASIRNDRKELQGIEVLHPAVSLMQIVPQYIRLSVDNTSGNLEYTRQNASDLLDELVDKYEKHFGRDAIAVSPQALLENWSNLSEGRIRDHILWSYTLFMDDLCKLIIYTGDISGLITDSELENAYLVAAAVQELPRMQERMVSINNLLRTLESGAFTQKRRDELERQFGLLIYSDNPRIQDTLQNSGTIRIWKGETEVSLFFENILKLYSIAADHFSNRMENFLDSQHLEALSFAVLNDAAVQVSSSAYQLQTASLARLQTLIENRVHAHRRRFAGSLALALAATFLAFAIVFVTVLNIRKSTHIANHVFSRLEKNNLSVSVKGFSQDELGELMTALGDFLEKLKTDFSLFSQNASMVSTAVYDLSASAKEITTTANEQSASVAEIVSTMENNKNLSAQVTVKTVEVADLAERTLELSQRGANLREANEDMMLDIKEQNAKIIDEIRNLADILSRVDESVQLIDTIADQTKLMAFNAALEASSSGEAGARFAVVAGEIRRFADNVMESVVEIKEKISELQGASVELITQANTGSRAIDSGYNRMVEQKEVFENIVDASQNVAIHSQQISNLSRQQELASAQIFTTLKEISAGVKQFVTATASTSATADNLNKMSIEAKETLAKYQTE